MNRCWHIGLNGSIERRGDHFVQTQTISIPELRDAVRGRLITPDDADYDQARTVTAGHIDRHPAAIVRVADAGDVATVIRLAGERGIELSVRCGGHSGA